MVAQVLKNQIERIDGEKKLFWILFSLSVLFIVLYGFLINKTIMNAVYKNNMQKEIGALNNEVDSLDYEYLGLEKGITTDLALSKGFVNITTTNIAYVSKENATALSLNKN